MPVDAGTGAHVDMVVIFAHNVDALNGHPNHQPVEVMAKQYIAASAQNQLGGIDKVGELEEGSKIVFVRNVDQIACLSVNAKRVVRLQRHIASYI